MKRVMSIICMCIIVLGISTTYTFAETEGTYSGFVIDMADILLPAEEEELLAEANKLSEKHNMDIGIITQVDIDMGAGASQYLQFYYESYLNRENINLVLFIGFDSLGRYAQVDIFNDYDDKVSDNELLAIQKAIQSGSEDKPYADRLSTGLSKANTVIKLYHGADVALLGFFPISYTGALVCAVISAIILVALIFRHNKNNKQVDAATYLLDNGVDVISRNDKYIRTDRDVQHGYYKKKSSSGGGGHRSSGGGRF